MKTTLEKVQQTLLNPTILDSKKYLQSLKKRGVIFIRENIYMLKVSDVINLYYFLVPSHRSQVDAFPIPIRQFQFYKAETDQYVFMRNFFESYYSISINDLNFFSQYDYKRPFVGTEYIWMYKHIEGGVRNEEKRKGGLP